MSFKIQIEKRLEFLKLVPKVRAQFGIDIKEPLKKEILDTLNKGFSPVKGERFAQYSVDYANRKKGGARRPVTLRDEGDLHESLDISVSRNRLRIRFEDFKAKYHNNQGAGRSKVIRRMLPDQKGETFRATILAVIRKVLDKSVKKVIAGRS